MDSSEEIPKRVNGSLTPELEAMNGLTNLCSALIQTVRVLGNILFEYESQLPTVHPMRGKADRMRQKVMKLNQEAMQVMTTSKAQREEHEEHVRVHVAFTSTEEYKKAYEEYVTALEEEQSKAKLVLVEKSLGN